MAESGERKFVCKVCGKGFKTMSELSHHNITHTKTRSFKCGVEGCTKSYARAIGLFNHKKTVHECVYYECEECGKRFGQKSHMKRHYETVHEEKKPFKCSKCGLKFSQNSN